jgi:NADH:ubiquinone oxidoreductase subunit 6 (subunit J)
VGGALAVVIASDPFVSALSLIINFASLGALYLMLHAPFVAMGQILVYAGAVVVLFLFVIAYLGDRRELGEDAKRMRWVRPAGAVAALVMAAVIGTVVLASRYPKPAALHATKQGHYDWGGASAVGEIFLTKYLLAFEVTSIVLLVAAIGGIALGLSGRARHDRLRQLMRTRSTDQQRKWYDQREKGRKPGERSPAPSDRTPTGAAR